VRAFILSVDVERRNLSKGQQAMARALLKPEPEKGGTPEKEAEGLHRREGALPAR
jgi:hypothetical protein